MRKGGIELRRYLWARRLLALSALAVALVYLRIAFSRVIYPFGLDLVEDGMLMQAWRVASRQPVFIPPNADFVPQVYMPFYTWLSGMLLRLTGFAFWPLRAVSMISTLMSAILIFAIGSKESRDTWTAALGAFLFLSGYRLVGGWYDLARVDALFLALSLAGMAAAVYGRHSSRGTLLSGLLLGLSLLTKQNGLLLTAVAGLYLWQVTRQRWGLFLLGFLITAAVPLLYLEYRSQGWFSYYVVDIAYASPIDLRRLWHYFGGEIAAGMGILGLLGGVAAAGHWQKRKVITLWQSPWFLFIGAGVVISLAGRASVGGNLNNLIIGYGLLCLTPALLAKQLPSGDGRAAEWKRKLLYAGILGQLILNQFQPFGDRTMKAIPTPQMEAAGQVLVERLAAVEGEVLVMMHPSFALKANKSGGVHIQSLWHARHRGQDPLPPDFVQRIERQQYALIISDDTPFFEQDPALANLMSQYYRLERTLGDAEAPSTLSGLIIRPLLVFVPADG